CTWPACRRRRGRRPWPSWRARRTSGQGPGRRAPGPGRRRRARAWSARGLGGAAHLDRAHAATVQHQGDLAALELQGVLAEGVAPPALQGRGLGLVVGGDLLEV